MKMFSAIIMISVTHSPQTYTQRFDQHYSLKHEAEPLYFTTHSLCLAAISTQEDSVLMMLGKALQCKSVT